MSRVFGSFLVIGLSQALFGRYVNRSLVAWIQWIDGKKHPRVVRVDALLNQDGGKHGPVVDPKLQPHLISPVIPHRCPNCLDRLDIFAEEGYDGYHFEWQIDAKEAVRIVGGRMSLVGNISNIQALLQGSPEDVYNQARYSIKAGVDILAPECAIPLQTPLENLKDIVTAAVDTPRN